MRGILKITIVVMATVCCGVAATVYAGALPEGEIEIMMALNPGDNEFPEGIAVDKKGNIFVSMAHLGEVWKITPAGDTSVMCVLDPESLFGVLGLAVDAPGNIYVADASFDPATQGVYRISRDGTACELLPGTEQIGFPNGLAFDKRGNLYITDAAMGAIYRFPKEGNSAQLWLLDPLLQGTGLVYGAFGGPPIGANGIQYWKRGLMVANTEQSTIVRVPILPDGSPGQPTVLYQGQFVVLPNGIPFPLEFFPDGIALDVHGNIFIADPAYSQIYLVAADGSWARSVATFETPLDNPSSLAFGTGRGDRKNLFIVNFDLLTPADEAAWGLPVNDQPHDGPSLVKMGAGNPGNPLP